MSDQTAETLPQKSNTVFRGSLVRTVVIALMIFSVVPAIIIGAISYLRFRNSLESQTTTQLSSISQTYSIQINQLVGNNQTILNKIATASDTNLYLMALLTGPSDPNYVLANYTLSKTLTDTISTSKDSGFAQISIINSAGKVLASSDQTISGKVLSVNEYVQSLYGSTKSVLTYNPATLFEDQLILVSTQAIKAGDNLETLTIIGFSNPPLLKTLLTNPLSVFTAAHVFYITSDNQIVSINPVLQAPLSVNITGDEKNTLNSMVTGSGYGKNYTYTNFTGIEVYSYFKQITAFNATYVFEVPVVSVLGQLQPLLNFMLILLGATLLAAGLIAFLATNQVVTPLVDLSNKARRYADGDFSQKAKVNRRDEIGLLANSFNHMVDQLTSFYQSLEAKVATRTEGLRTSLDIGQDAIASPTKNEIFQKIVHSIIERLGFTYSSIYIVDKTAKNLILTEDYSQEHEGLPERNLLVPLDNTSLIGWVAKNNEARLSQDVINERPKMLTTTRLNSSRADFALPISIGGKVIGVLDIQSDQVNAFDIESIPSFSIISNQIATGLRNIELLETTQVNYQETVVLYGASREIIQSQNEEEVYRSLTDLFKKTELVSFFMDVDNDEVKIVNLADTQSLPLDKSLIGTILPFAKAIEKLSNNGMEVIDNFQLLTEFSTLNAYFGRRNCTSLTLIPVYEGKLLKHIMAIGSRAETALTPSQMQPFASLSETIGATLERIHLMDVVAKKETEFAALTSIAKSTTQQTGGNVFERTHEELINSLGADLGFCVAINKPEQNKLNIPYYFDQELVEIEDYPYSTDLLSQIIQKAEPVVLRDAILSGQRIIDSSLIQRSAKSMLGIPMFNGNKVIGAVALFDITKAGRFNLESQKLIELVASQLAASISEDQLLRQLQETQKSFEKEQFLLNSLMENIPDRITFKNNNNEFIRVSRSLAEFAGVSNPTNLIGNVDTFRFNTEQTDENKSSDNEIISTHTPLLNKFEQWKNRNGETEWVVSSKIPLTTSDGVIYGLLSISQDITNMVKAENLARHRADQLLTASDIARESSSGTMDIQVTLARLVELICSRFGFYHASIFLIDPLNRYAVLRESTGEAGAQMKQKGHKLAVGSPSIVGQATGKGVPVVIGDVTKEENYFANPLLPETRSELAIPLKIGDTILGALDVQSQKLDAFSQEEINILQVLTDQIAVAIQNANLFTHTRETLTRHRLLHQITNANVQAMTIEDSIRAAIETLHQAMPEEQITYLSIDKDNLLTVLASAGYINPDAASRKILFGQGIIGSVARDHQAMRVVDVLSNSSYRPIGVDSNSVLAIPVIFADRLLGVINIESTKIALFDENDQEFVTTLADNLASIISNIQLVEQVRSQVDRQQKLFDITDKIRRSVDIETIMQTSVTEICSALNIRKASIQINPKFQSDHKKEQE